MPRSSARTSQQSYIKLLNYVDPEGQNGFGFEGTFFKAGRTVPEAELHPAGYPETPILLEHAGASCLGRGGHNRTDYLYILWRYDQAEKSWVELGRARSASWEWALDLRPLAIRALREARGSNLEVLPSLVLITGRICLYLDTALKPLERVDRERVLAVLHDQFACRRAAAM